MTAYPWWLFHIFKWYISKFINQFINSSWIVVFIISVKIMEMFVLCTPKGSSFKKRFCPLVFTSITQQPKNGKCFPCGREKGESQMTCTICLPILAPTHHCWESENVLSVCSRLAAEFIFPYYKHIYQLFFKRSRNLRKENFLKNSTVKQTENNFRGNTVLKEKGGGRERWRATV